ncbi:MAG: TonB-dependent receptor [Pseudomonadota bacterium]
MTRALRRALLIGTTSCIAVASSTTVWAQGLDEIVVTALKREQTAIKTPAAISVFNETAIERANITRPNDFVSLIPNAALIDSNTEGEAFLVLRGMAPARNAETSTAVIIDGVLAAGPNELNQDFFAVSQIEVLKGPQGALYGRNAVGGAVVISTKEPTNEFEGQIKVGAGEQARVLAQTTVSGPIVEDRLFARIAYSHHERDGKRESAATGEDRDRFERETARVRLDWLPTDNIKVDLRAGGSLQRDTGGIAFVAQFADDGVFDTNNDGLLEVNGAIPNFDNNVRSFNDQDKYNGSIKIDWESDLGTLTSVSAYTFVEDRYGQDNFPYLSGDAGAGGLTQWVLFNTQGITQEFRWTSSSEKRFRYIAGVYAAFIESDRVTNLAEDEVSILLDGRQPNPVDSINTTLTFRDDTTNRENLAAFAHVELDVTDALEVTAAVRYDHEDAEVLDKAPPEFTTTPGLLRKDSYDRIQPKFTANYSPVDSFSVYAAYGEGFKAGGFNPFGSAELIRAANPLSTVVDEYGEETSRSGELGFKAQMLDNRLQVNAAGFVTRGKNFQVFEFFPGPSLQAIAQVEKVKINGGEFDFVFAPTDNLTLSGGVGYTKSTVDELVSDPTLEGNRLPYTPILTGSLSGQHIYPVSSNLDLVTRVDWRYTGNTWWNLQNTEGTRRDGINVVDIKAGIEHERWAFQAWAKNLLNNDYFAEVVVIFPTVAASAPAPLRFWGVDFTYKF